jgi:putative spermidine/putrescine transport system ATP-binding protein
MTSDGVSVRLANCARTFTDGTRALKGCDLVIESGETIVLLGPSGCGKTTLLRIIAGLDFPDPGGHVCFDERDVTELPVEKRGVGMVFQSYALFPNMDVAQNIAYGLTVRRIAGAERDRRGDRHARDDADRRVATPADRPALRRATPAGGTRACNRSPTKGVAAR